MEEKKPKRQPKTKIVKIDKTNKKALDAYEATLKTSGTPGIKTTLDFQEFVNYLIGIGLESHQKIDGDIKPQAVLIRKHRTKNNNTEPDGPPVTHKRENEVLFVENESIG